MLTTSREPSNRLTQFVKELRIVFPNSQRINRGNTVIKEIVDVGRKSEFTDIILVHEHRGEPGVLSCVRAYVCVCVCVCWCVRMDVCVSSDPHCSCCDVDHNNVDGLIVSHLPYGPTAYFGLTNCVLRHDLPNKMDNMSEAYPHLIFHSFQTKLGQRLSNVLKYLFPVPKDESKRVITFANQDDYISFRY